MLSFYGNYDFTTYDSLHHTPKALKLQDFRARLWHTIFLAWRGATGGGKLTLPTQSSYLAGKEKESYRKGGKSANQITTEIKTEPLPQSVIESLAQALLPQMQDFFESEQGKQALEKWRKERERHS